MPSSSGYGEAQYYEDDEDYMIDPRTLDLADRQELLLNNKNRVYDLTAKLKSEQEAKEKAIAEAKQKADEDVQKLKMDTVGTPAVAAQ